MRFPNERPQLYRCTKERSAMYTPRGLPENPLLQRRILRHSHGDRYKSPAPMAASRPKQVTIRLYHSQMGGFMSLFYPHDIDSS